MTTIVFGSHASEGDPARLKLPRWTFSRSQKEFDGRIHRKTDGRKQVSSLAIHLRAKHSLLSIVTCRNCIRAHHIMSSTV
jgi:hypothetical protein